MGIVYVADVSALTQSAWRNCDSKRPDPQTWLSQLRVDPSDRYCLCWLIQARVCNRLSLFYAQHSDGKFLFAPQGPFSVYNYSVNVRIVTRSLNLECR